MLNPADVLKIKCNFVSEVLRFLNKRKYVIDVCPCILYPYYGEHGLTSVVDSDCLSYTNECVLLDNKYSTPTECEATLSECDDQLAIALTTTTSPCTLLAYTLNRSNGSTYPTMFTTDDSIYVNGTLSLKLVATGDCTVDIDYVTIYGGASSLGTSDDYKSTCALGHYSPYTSFKGTTASYVKSLRVYETDEFGVLINTPIDLDLDPSTSIYYADTVDCPGCTALLPSEVELGDPNFTTNFETLMDNVSIARYGSPGFHNISATFFSSSNVYRVFSIAKHNPASYHFGIHRPNGNLWIKDPATNKDYIQGINYFSTGSVKFYYDSSNFSPDPDIYDCADITPIIGNQNSAPQYDTSAYSFNYIAFTSPYGTKQINVTSQSTASCSITLLTATYDETLVTSVEWLDPSDMVISTSATAAAVNPGVYTFNATLLNGCIATSTITIS